MKCTDTLNSPLGALYITFDKDRLLALSFTSKPGLKHSRAPESITRELLEYFSGARREFGLAFELEGATDFERAVWLALRDIPFGETRSYKWVAEHIGKPLAARAVGRALSNNPLPIVLPCHRVIESRGTLGGYSEGERIKVRLLDLEHFSK